jgi:chromosome segregation ATPase
MFNAWRHSSQNKDGDGSDNAQVSQLRRMLEELRRNSQGHAKPSEPHTAASAVTGSTLDGVTHADPAVNAPDIAAEANLEDLPAVQRLIAEQRQAAEALLAEVASLEAQLELEMMMADAQQQSASAETKKAALRETEQLAQTSCGTLLARRQEIEARQGRTEAEWLAAEGRLAEVQAEIAELEERLRILLDGHREAALLVERTKAEHAALVRDKAAAEEEIAVAHERLAACRVDTAAAQTEAELAGARVNALRESLSEQSVDSSLASLQRLALRIAEEAAAMATAAEEKKRAKRVLI